jgi:hypothetical protein
VKWLKLYEDFSGEEISQHLVLSGKDANDLTLGEAGEFLHRCLVKSGLAQT